MAMTYPAKSRLFGVRWLSFAISLGFSIIVAMLLVRRIGLVPELPAVLVFLTIAAVLAPIDLDRHLLPNAIVLPSFMVILVLLGLAALMEADLARLGAGLLGSAGMFSGYFLVALLSPRSMGMGDVKLAAVIGLLLGYFGATAWFIGLCAAFIFGGLVTVVLLISKRARLSTQVPFGPAMLAGAIFALVL